MKNDIDYLFMGYLLMIISCFVLAVIALIRNLVYKKRSLGIHTALAIIFYFLFAYSIEYDRGLQTWIYLSQSILNLIVVKLSYDINKN